MTRQYKLFLWGSSCASFLTFILWSVFGEKIVLYSGVHSVTALAIIAVGVFGSIHFYYCTMADLTYEDEHRQKVHGNHAYAPFGTLARAIDRVLNNPELHYPSGFRRWRHRPSVELGIGLVIFGIGIFFIIPNIGG